MENLPNYFRSTVVQLGGKEREADGERHQKLYTSTYIWPNTNPYAEIKRKIENSMIRKSQILNFHSKDFTKKWFLLKFPNIFFGKIILENF